MEYWAWKRGGTGEKVGEWKCQMSIDGNGGEVIQIRGTDAKVG